MLTEKTMFFHIFRILNVYVEIDCIDVEKSLDLERKDSVPFNDNSRQPDVIQIRKPYYEQSNYILIRRHDTVDLTLKLCSKSLVAVDDI